MSPFDSSCGRAPWRSRLDLFTRALVAVLWLVAATLKLADPAAFARDIENYRVVPALVAAAVAVYLPWLEIALGVGLWLPRFRETARVLSLVVLLGFCGALLSALARGLDIECGCFGSGGPDASASWALARNLVLIALLAATRRG
jgi:uncharacterized membrane protein YphA (DoxX/SURF4 family)